MGPFKWDRTAVEQIKWFLLSAKPSMEAKTDAVYKTNFDFMKPRLIVL